jgi:uncharacterized membrane protein (DUF485 family)
MRIEYENKFSDLVLYQAIHQFLSVPLQIFFVLFYLFIFWSESLTASVVSSAITAFFWWVGVWIVQFVFNAVYFWSRNNRSVIGRHAIEVQDGALMEETKYNKSFFYWPGVVKAVSRPGFVAIYVTPHIAHWIPNRAFSSGAQREDFLTLVREKIRGATGT